MKKFTLISMFAVMVAALLMGGCMRKHIVSTPPAQRPATQPETAKAPEPAPKVVEEQPGLIDETYVVDGPAEPEAPTVVIQEGDLEEEPIATSEQTGNAPAGEVKAETSEAVTEAVKPEVTDEAGTAAVIATPEAEAVVQPEAVVEETVSTEPKETVEATPMAEMYYVQIGAFGDLENANRALARLLSDGYKGSKLSKTDNGLFRVQAGAFPDEASAEEALSKLLADYPKGFVLKTD